jgi:Tetrahydrofolate dehydrogenase/cyclohydrolase, catalytic domain
MLYTDPKVNGILVQLPLPGHLDEQAIIERIAQHKVTLSNMASVHNSSESTLHSSAFTYYVRHCLHCFQDVDGLHPLNVAQLANTKTHAPGRAAWSFDSIGFHVSCTPQVTTLPISLLAVHPVTLMLNTHQLYFKTQ